LLRGLERSNVRWFANLYRSRRTPWDLLRTPPWVAFLLSFVLWCAAVVHTLLAKSPTSSDFITLALASVIAGVAVVWYHAPTLRWPYNALGFVLATDAVSAKGLPRDTTEIRSLITAVWEERFGAEVTRATEHLWHRSASWDTAVR
jgi:hypothetical protein